MIYRKLNDYSGYLKGGQLSPIQQANILSLSTSNNYAFSITIDGVSYPHAINAIPTSTDIASLNSFAFFINTNLIGASCFWNPNFNRFEIKSDTTGELSSVSFCSEPTIGNDISSIMLLRDGLGGYTAFGGTGDYQMGMQSSNFVANTPETVAQAVLTTLRLFQGEWFLDSTVGVPYETKILGFGNMMQYDYEIKNAILGVSGVTGIENYYSFVNTTTRSLYVQVTINTVYGQTQIGTQI